MIWTFIIKYETPMSTYNRNTHVHWRHARGGARRGLPRRVHAALPLRERVEHRARAGRAAVERAAARLDGGERARSALPGVLQCRFGESAAVGAWSGGTSRLRCVSTPSAVTGWVGVQRDRRHTLRQRGRSGCGGTELSSQELLGDRRLQGRGWRRWCSPAACGRAGSGTGLSCGHLTFRAFLRNSPLISSTFRYLTHNTQRTQLHLHRQEKESSGPLGVFPVHI